MRDIHRYPTGARPLLIAETARRRQLESRLVTILEQQRFAEVILPMIDLAEPYGAITGSDAARQSYRFVDREGDLVALRSDFTPMVARALAPSLDRASLPLRVFYRGDVLRCSASRLGSNREIFQIGAEIIGEPSPSADVAVLRLAAAIMREFGLRPLVVYTDASIASRFDAATRDALITKRRSSGIPPLAARLIAGTATLDDVATLDSSAAERLRWIGNEIGDDGAFVLHLDDVEDAAPYYTGLRFRVYGSDLRTPIAEGGRYDSLYSRFGTDAAAVGFTFTIDDIEPQPGELQHGLREFAQREV
jgi:ATP phosphoribosyltransferase regulatory subunit